MPTSNNPLKELQFSEGGGSFIKSFPAKLRVLSTDPLINNDKYGNTRYSFAVWSYDEKKPMILSKGASIARPIQQIDADPDYGEDVTAVDLKITSQGEGKETRYSVNVLPKTETLTAEQEVDVRELDDNLSKIIKNGIRASEFNQGAQLPTVDLEDESGVDLNDIFPDK